MIGTATVITAITSVWNQLIIKGFEVPVNLQNSIMYFFGSIIATASYVHAASTHGGGGHGDGRARARGRHRRLRRGRQGAALARGGGGPRVSERSAVSWLLLGVAEGPAPDPSIDICMVWAVECATRRRGACVSD